MEKWKDYIAYSMSSVTGDWQNLLIICSFVLIVALAYTYHTDWYMESAVSRRKKRTRYRKALSVAADAITTALEKEHQKGQLKREEIDRMYDCLRQLPEFREIGPEPTFGKPWYSCPEVVKKSAHKLKGEIKSRLERMGVDTVTKLSSLKQRRTKRTNTDVLNEVIASIRKV